MSDDVRDETSTTGSPVEVDGPPADGASLHDVPSLIGPLGRRAVLQSIASGLGVAVLASPASAHVHQAATPAKPAAAGTGVKPAVAGATGLVFLDRHAFDTLTLLADQIVPGARAAKVPEFLDRLLAVESTETQKRFTQALGAFERQAREAHGKPWKTLTAAQATALLGKMSEAPAAETVRRAFEFLKGGVAETYFSTQVGMKELGWNGGVMFAAPIACG